MLETTAEPRSNVAPSNGDNMTLIINSSRNALGVCCVAKMSNTFQRQWTDLHEPEENIVILLIYYLISSAYYKMQRVLINEYMGQYPTDA
jgi:hypothetical protein